MPFKPNHKMQKNLSSKRGFTLMELMVAMAITTIIVTVLVSITSIALDTWNRSRSELRASRQAKGMLDVMARDLEALVIRRGNVNEWFSSEVDPDLNKIGDKFASTNAARIVFFTAITDRYDGKIGTSSDLGGDVSCVDYKLEYKEPFGPGGSTNDFKTFILSRLVVNPDVAFRDLLGQTNMSNALQGNNQGNVTLRDTLAGKSYAKDIEKPENFVCENIFQFSLSFAIEIKRTVNNVTTALPLFITIPNKSPAIDELSLTGGGILLKEGGIVSTLGMDGFTREEILGGRLTAVQISATVLSDFGLDQVKRRTFKNESDKAKFLAQNSYQYTKLVQLPSM
jgi:prepilin-type N-terminal cleavage/methylation domain-containing protein